MSKAELPPAQPGPEVPPPTTGSRPGAESRTVVGWFLEQVRRRAALPAMNWRSPDGWVAISWAELGSGARRFAAYLLGEDLAQAGHVAIWSGNRPEWHVADAGVMLAGAIPVPVYATLSAEQAAYVLDHSETVVAVVEDGTALARVLEMRERLPRLRRVVVVAGVSDPSPDGFVLPWLEALSRGTAALERADVAAELDRRAAAINLDDVATLIYTSGTTGPPKAVQLTHRNLLAAETQLLANFTAGPDDRILSYLPLAHVVERLASELLSFRHGNAVWFLDRLDNLGPVLREVRPTIFFGVPRVWEKMALRIEHEVAETSGPRGRIARWGFAVAQEAERRGAAGEPIRGGLRRRRALAERLVLRRIRERTGLDRARHLVSGAAPMGMETLRFFHALGMEISEGYGQTENTAMATMNPPRRVRFGTVGPPTPGVELRIADDGEVLTRGATVFPGYFKDGDGTREVLDSEGWLHTGDIGELDRDGYLRLTGRKKDLIITAGGKNIAPSVIEGRLIEHRLVSHAVCIGDRRPYVIALLTVDAEEAARWGAERGLGQSSEELARSPELRAELERWVAEVNQGLSRPEQVKRWRLLASGFEVGRELTPTLKVRRRVIVEQYAAEIEALYA